MGKKSRFDCAYNAQISVDADLKIIVAQHISQSANDKHELEPGLKAIMELDLVQVNILFFDQNPTSLKNYSNQFCRAKFRKL
jgi:hypothetical protein